MSYILRLTTRIVYEFIVSNLKKLKKFNTDKGTDFKITITAKIEDKCCKRLADR